MNTLFSLLIVACASQECTTPEVAYLGPPQPLLECQGTAMQRMINMKLLPGDGFYRGACVETNAAKAYRDRIERSRS